MNLRKRLGEIVRATPPLMRVLSGAGHLCLPDWLLFSGAVYQPVLNHLTGRPLDYGIKDYDLGYFDDSDLSYEAEDVVIRRVKAAFDEPLRSMVEVRNQARVGASLARFKGMRLPGDGDRSGREAHISSRAGWISRLLPDRRGG